ncbi:outer membrane protein assembly factor BamE [Veillonella sp. CHU110]|uniref:outer membrane protein assembly factor BamE domain-containing protein n=1 Tax=Veillonella sp. CHU110 TaxID=2490947 RepID=UPI000F8E0851|nr:outer membrane protein assembly factor BamE [Veillonella sp. CHU110]
MLKKCLVGCLAVSSLLFTAVNAYDYNEYDQKLVNRMSGEWKNLDGQVVFNIQNGYINGAQVLDVAALAGNRSFGVGNFIIHEAVGNRPLRMSFASLDNSAGRIVYNGQALFRKVPVPYSESVSGIHIGSTKDEVLQTFGRPTRTWGDVYDENWEYANYKMRVRLGGGTVTAVSMFKGSPLRFDTSGLSYGDGKYEFMGVYDIHNSGGPAMKVLPTGETINYNSGLGHMEITLDPLT